MTKALTTALPPYTYDLLGLLVVLIFALRGARRGFAKELTSVLSLLAAFALARPFGSFLGSSIPLPPLPSFLQTPVTLSIGAVAAYLIARIALSIGVRLSGLHREPEGALKAASEFGGAGLRGGVGLLTCVIIGWSIVSTGRLSALLLSAAPRSESHSRWMDTLLLPIQFTAGHSDAFAQSLLGKLSSLTNPFPQGLIEGTEVLVEVMRAPANMKRLATYEPVRKVVEQPSVQELLRNPEIRAFAAKQDVVKLLNHPAMKKVLEDPALQEALRQIDPKELRKFLQK